MVFAHSKQESVNRPETRTKKSSENVPLANDEGVTSILVVDDTPEKLLATEAVLSELGQKIVKARTGREALKAILKQDFAVILLDINMPGMDGFETATLIRQRQATAHTPIIFVTSFSTGEIEVYRGYSLGAVDYLFTPVIPEVLRSKVTVFIELEKKRQQIRRQAEALRLAEEERMQRKLEETTQRLEWETRRNHFFRLSIELLAIANYQGLFAQTNPTWEKVLGYTEEDLRGQSLLGFIHPDDETATREVVASITKSDTPLYFESRFRARDDAYRWLGWTIAPFAAEGLLYIFARDITERQTRDKEIRSLNDDLKRQASVLQSLNKELESFSYSIAHDLRTPLLAISGYSEMLLDGEAGEITTEAMQMVRAVRRNSTHMAQLIDDFLAFFRVGRQEINAGFVDMQTLASEAVGHAQPVGDRRVVEFKIRALPNARGDSAMIRQVLVNLISNAVKFTGPSAQPTVEVGYEEREKRHAYYVKDNGVGFDMKHYNKLFGVFERLHTREEFDGTGLGLAIVQKIVQRHGGRVWAESKLNEGATFYFTLTS